MAVKLEIKNKQALKALEAFLKDGTPNTMKGAKAAVEGACNGAAKETKKGEKK